MLRKKKVVGKFVEFYGNGLSTLPLADRATIGNMAPEYGATMGFFPVDAQTLDYLRLTGRGERPRGARRGVLQGAGTFSNGRHARPGVHRHDRARSHDGRAEPRRAQAAAGPRAAPPREAHVPRRAHGGSRAPRGHRCGSGTPSARRPPRRHPSSPRRRSRSLLRTSPMMPVSRSK